MRVLHIRAVAIYFGAVLVLRLAAGWYLKQPWENVATSILWLSALGAATIAFLAWVARLIARGTVYTVTTRRVVMRFGVVVPMSINIPFTIVQAAGLRTYADGTGDIPLRLGGDGRIAYPHLWPHARPWSMQRPEPMLRCLPEAGFAATILADALGQAAR